MDESNMFFDDSQADGSANEYLTNFTACFEPNWGQENEAFSMESYSNPYNQPEMGQNGFREEKPYTEQENYRSMDYEGAMAEQREEFGFYGEDERHQNYYRGEIDESRMSVVQESPEEFFGDITDYKNSMHKKEQRMSERQSNNKKPKTMDEFLEENPRKAQRYDSSNWRVENSNVFLENKEQNGFMCIEQGNQTKKNKHIPNETMVSRNENNAKGRPHANKEINIFTFSMENALENAIILPSNDLSCSMIEETKREEKPQQIPRKSGLEFKLPYGNAKSELNSGKSSIISTKSGISSDFLQRKNQPTLIPKENKPNEPVQVRNQQFPLKVDTRVVFLNKINMPKQNAEPEPKSIRNENKCIAKVWKPPEVPTECLPEEIPQKEKNHVKAEEKEKKPIILENPLRLNQKEIQMETMTLGRKFQVKDSRPKQAEETLKEVQSSNFKEKKDLITGQKLAFQLKEMKNSIMDTEEKTETGKMDKKPQGFSLNLKKPEQNSTINSARVTLEPQPKENTFKGFNFNLNKNQQTPKSNLNLGGLLKKEGTLEKSTNLPLSGTKFNFAFNAKPPENTSLTTKPLEGQVKRPFNLIKRNIDEAVLEKSSKKIKTTTNNAGATEKTIAFFDQTDLNLVKTEIKKDLVQSGGKRIECSNNSTKMALEEPKKEESVEEALAKIETSLANLLSRFIFYKTIYFEETGRDMSFTREFQRTRARADILNKLISEFEFQNGLVEFPDFE